MSLVVNLHCTLDWGKANITPYSDPILPPPDAQSTPTRTKETHHESTTTRRKSGPGLGLTAKIAIATATAAAVVTGVGVSAARPRRAHTATSADAYSFEAFRETIKPWDSISIPALSCPSGYFQDVEPLSRPHRPQGRRGPGTQCHRRHDRRGEERRRHRLVEQAAPPGHGHRPRQRVLDRHELGPFSSHELIIRLHCTTDLSKAYKDPSPYS